jgi:hypothetical protein
VLCPACLQPGKNLITGWQDAPDDKRYTLIIVSVTGSNVSSHKWLYALFLGIDANFRLKHKKISSNKANPDLNHGCAYFVEEREYKEYLSQFIDEVEPVCLASMWKALILMLLLFAEVHLLLT